MDKSISFICVLKKFFFYCLVIIILYIICLSCLHCHVCTQLKKKKKKELAVVHKQHSLCKHKKYRREVMFRTRISAAGRQSSRKAKQQQGLIFLEIAVLC